MPNLRNSDIWKGETGYKLYRDAFLNPKAFYEALDDESIQFTFEDALSLPQATVWLPKVITEISRNAIEPRIVITPLFDRIQWEPGLQILRGGTGALVASDVAELEAFPEVQLQVGGSSVISAMAKKSGIAFKLSEEMLRLSPEVVRLHIEEAGRALKRHKEKKAVDIMSSMGIVVFDNAAPTSSLNGVTHGRDSSGAANGSITPDDMFDLFAVGIRNNFQPDLLIMHPLTWVAFMKDAHLRLFSTMAGGGSWWGEYFGQPAGKDPWSLPSKLHESQKPNINNKTPISGYPTVPVLESGPVFPAPYSPFPFQVLISPYVFFDPSSKLTDLILCQRGEIGALLTDYEPTMDEWDDRSVGARKIVIRERYTFNIYHEGQGILLVRNLRIEPNAIVLPPQATIASSSLPSIPANTPVV